MNRIATAAVIGIVLLAGCLSGTPQAGTPTNVDGTETPGGDEAPATTNDESPTATPAGTATDVNTPSQTPGSGPNASLLPGANASVTNYDVRVALIGEFEPGTTFGMPAVYTNETVEETITAHPDLADRLRESFDTSDRRDLFHRIQQYRQIAVTAIGNGTYEFTVRDGQTCTIHTINGTYQSGSVTGANETTRSVPC